MSAINKRREIIKNGLMLGLLTPFLSLPSCQSRQKVKENATFSSPDKLKILILGGTSFLGPHQIAYAMGRGHDITTFTRGKTKPTIHQDLFDDVTMLIGDRNDDLSALENKEWDVVIDNSGHNVEWTKDSANLLKNKCKVYVYISSTGVYYPYLTENIDKQTKPLLVEPNNIEDEDLKIEYWYGVMKANSELQAKAAFGDDQTLIIRPTYMIGPADKSHRFIHWPLRMAKAGDVLVPGKADDPVQYIDVRDVAAFTIELIEQKVSGTYNAVGPNNSETIREFALNASKAFNRDHNLIQVDDYEFLKGQGIKDIVPWIMPEGNNYGTARINNSLAQNAGLKFRKLEDSLVDTYNWWTSSGLSEEFKNKYLLDPKTNLAREKEILTAWSKI